MNHIYYLSLIYITKFIWYELYTSMVTLNFTEVLFIKLYTNVESQ